MLCTRNVRQHSSHQVVPGHVRRSRALIKLSASRNAGDGLRYKCSHCSSGLAPCILPAELNSRLPAVCPD